MNETEKVTEWVEYKIGQLLSDDIEKRIDSESSSFDVEKYSQELFEEHFLGEVEENVRETDFDDLNLKLNLEIGDYYLTDNLSDDSNEDDQYDYRLASLDNIIQDLQDPSEATQIRALESLEACSAEELVIQNSWTIARKILQDMIKKSESEKLSSRILELFRRFLSSNDTPKVVCEGFVSLAESITFQIEAINIRKRKGRVKEAYDFKTNKWMHNSVPDGDKDIEVSSAVMRVIVKAMWLLVQSQKGIPSKWSRFNEKRLREIVFSFIHMLCSTKNLKSSDCICGLEILSVLDPRAVWVSNWCHGATGRTLLCSALKINKKLFDEMVDFVIAGVKTKGVRPGNKNSIMGVKLPPLVENERMISTRMVHRSENIRNKSLYSNDQKLSARLTVNENETSKGNRSAPTMKSNENLYEIKKKKERQSDWILNGIPKEVVEEAKLCHCLSMVVFLIQYKGGRSLFPLEVTCRRRRMTVADFVATALTYINGLLFFSDRSPLITDVYREHMLKLLHILKSI